MSPTAGRQGAGATLARKLSCRPAACDSHVEECSLIVFRLLERAGHAPAPALVARVHIQLAERLPSLLRSTDNVEVEALAGIAVVLHEAGYAGALAARER